MTDIVSIIILNYNGLNYLKQSIHKVFSLSYPNTEIIVFDNNSTDGSIEYLKTFPKITLIESSTNLGYSKGKNSAIEHAKGKYLLILDNDIIIPDANILEKLIDNYNEKTAFLQVPLVDIDKTKTWAYGIYFSIYGVNLHRKQVEIDKILRSDNKLIEIAGATGGFMFVERKKWQELGGFDQNQTFNLDDIDIGPRAIIFGYKNYLYTETFVTHAGIVHTQSKDLYVNRFKLIFSGHARSLIKNYNLKNVLLYLPILVMFQSAKAVRDSFLKKTMRIFFAYCQSFFRFFINLKDTLHERKLIQQKRKIKTDDFLKIKVPKF